MTFPASTATSSFIAQTNRIKETALIYESESSVRLLTFPTSIIPVLKQHKADQLASRIQIDTNREGGESPEDDFIFTQWNGKPMFPYSMNKWLRNFVNVNNLTKITPHIFRHMTATYLITASHDIRAVSDTPY